MKVNQTDVTLEFGAQWLSQIWFPAERDFETSKGVRGAFFTHQILISWPKYVAVSLQIWMLN